ncbi:MAG TPA: proprotein convertase P-domain-containing protein [Candidatus Polarisedimenticolaceae bacterium]|nr:proprotein convertase P-domain-containing protein [Candidatus Polarisedimenticolaceae bacterium]
MRRSGRVRLSLAFTFIAITAAVAFQVKPPSGRFDTLVIPDPSTVSGVATTPDDALPAQDTLRTGWSVFRATHGQQWRVWLDRRSGAPMLVEGSGLKLIDGSTTLDRLEALTRQFASSNRTLLLANDSELVLNRAASVQFGQDSWQVVFDRYVSGVPVLGDRYLFAISHGNLVQFGAPRWTKITGSPVPEIDAAAARDRLKAYMGITAHDTVKVLESGALQMLPVRVGEGAGAVPGPYNGTVGAGYQSRLIWRVGLEIVNEPGQWIGLVDASDGAIVAFFDDNEYAQVKGGVFPVSNDGNAPDGIEKPAYPMPFADIAIGASNNITNSMGSFTCSPGGSNATTHLAGQYVRVNDTCGPISQSVSCDADLDLGVSAGTDCTVPPGGSPGDTHAARSSFYHLNRISEHARPWLPNNTWLTQQLTDNVNLNQTCNAYWNGSTVNFFKSGGGCANTGEIAGVFLHEWGHGLDQNDGGGTDNPGEAYGDITALMSTHVSCVGRGFFQSGNCSGYGDACLNCTGIRDQDWDMHASHTPATPQGFLTNNCGGGGGPCGKEVHCEGYVSAETLWDLATRDLPASGLDTASSWQLADKLWYKSRNGSGGNAYTCALPNSDGCASTSWFSKIRVQDDDDGNLSNGTPHAAAIFAAFNRHHIACGNAGDASNQSSSSCPSIAAPVLTTTAGSSSASLSWTPVANAATYRILRNDAGCDAGSAIIATVNAPTTTYTDSGLANGFTEYYHVQAVGTNTNCDGVLSDCSNVAPQPFAGTVKLDAGAYNCASLITVTVTDANIGSTTTTVKITSNAEPLGETVTLTQVNGSANYLGTISTTSSPAGADGLLSVADGNTITATYIDADDGQGGTNLTRTATAGADCLAPLISNVQATSITGTGARITWSTNESSNSVVHYGPSAPPGGTAFNASPAVNHTVDLNGLAECTPYLFSVQSSDAVANLAVDDNGGSYYPFTTVKNVQPSYPYNGLPVSIPDNNPIGATASIIIPDSKQIVDLNVTVDNLTHTSDGELTLHIIGPDNTDVVLSAGHGGSGHNYTATTFDDAAVIPISSGSAPFTGTFRPDQPLSAFNGKNAAGTWKFFVVDSGSGDIGTINAVTLTFTFPAAACGPHAAYRTHGVVGDACPAGGAPGNSIWEAGETVNFKVNLQNDGSTTLTGVTATVVPLTAGVAMTDPSASYPSMGPNTNADSIAPHFTAKLSTAIICGTTITFRLDVTANEGSWSSTFIQTVGQPYPPSTGTALSEAFASGIPNTWTVVDGGRGGGAAATWTTANPGGRSIVSPMAAPVPIVDSGFAGGGSSQDEQLITPNMDLSLTTSVTLVFDEHFHVTSGQDNSIGDVDVQSSKTGGAWVNVLRHQGGSTPNPAHQSFDITSQAAGATNVKVRFHYWQGKSDGWWQVDNVQVNTVSTGGCNQVVCPGGPTSVKPVPDGAFGAGMTATRSAADGSQIGLAWDVSTCVSTGYHVLYGDLAAVASSTVSGSVCGLGASGSYAWTSVPGSNLWFVVAADDGTATEGSWGTTSSGERGGTSASGQCGMSTRNNSGSCP